MNCNYLMFFTGAVTQVHASRTRQTCVWPLATSASNNLDNFDKVLQMLNLIQIIIYQKRNSVASNFCFCFFVCVAK